MLLANPLARAAALAACLLAGCAAGPDTSGPAAPPPVFPPPPEAPRFVYERSLYASSDVIEKDRNSELRRLLTGEAERGGEAMGKPYGVAARRGRVFVADSVAASVKVFDIPGKRFLTIGSAELRQPLGLDVDDAGVLYVVDATAKTVRMFDAEGKALRQLGGPKDFARPVGVAVDAAGTRVYVVDAGGVDKSAEHRVRVYDPRSGAHLFDFGRRGSQAGEFNLPRDVAVAPAGTVYVVDSGNFRIQAFDRDGRHLFSFGSVGRFPGQFARPREIAVDAAGQVYVSDAAFGNFQIFDAEGRLLLFVGERSERDAPARYMLPAGIAVDLDGRIYMADQFFRKVDVFRPATLKPEEGFAAPRLAAEADALPASRNRFPTSPGEAGDGGAALR